MSHKTASSHLQDMLKANSGLDLFFGSRLTPLRGFIYPTRYLSNHFSNVEKPKYEGGDLRAWRLAA